MASRPPGRVAAIAGNAGYLLRVPLAIGLDPLLPQRYAELVAQMNGEPLAEFENLVLYLEDRSSRLWPLLGARYRVVPQDRLTPNASPPFALEQDPTGLPRAFAVEKLELVEGPEASLRAMADTAFAPASVAVIERDATGPLAPSPISDPERPARAELQRSPTGRGT